MAKVISLTKARKARARDADKAQAEQNRVLHGRTKGEKAEAAAAASHAARLLDGHKREPES